MASTQKKLCSSNLVYIELLSAKFEDSSKSPQQRSDGYSVQNLQLLLQRIANSAVVVELRTATGMTGDAFRQAGWDVIAGLHPVNQPVPEHVAPEL